ncbi:MAG: RNA polymerase sigma factor [Chitinophagaceae bacterium]|jgi:RNA polymerase sigma-70 factor (ECF subfamily)|nr:RNA polymerase sigma factor [Chitinophagaceae bacterium]
MKEVLFENIYNEHKNVVYNLCLHYGLTKEDAQDITQEVFVKVHQNSHLYNSTIASFKTWICRITVNHCLDFLKSKKTKKRLGFITSLFYPSNNEPLIELQNVQHPGIISEEKERLQNLLNIINTLPNNQKTAIILTKIDGRPQQEVAEIMNLSLKAIESLLQRAKNNIANKLTQSEG